MIKRKLFQSAGQQSSHITPGAYSRIDSIRNTSGLLALNNGIILGKSNGGKPHTLYRISSKAQAVDIFRSGELVDALSFGLNPGNDITPQYLYGMRVNNAKQAEEELDTKFIAKSKDYGVYTNLISISISTEKGKRNVEVKFRDITEKFDGIKRESFRVQSTQPGATIAIRNTDAEKKLTITWTGLQDPYEVALDKFSNMEELVASLNTINGVTATTISGQENSLPSQLDAVTSEKLHENGNPVEVTLQSTNQAIIDAVNEGSYYITLERNPNNDFEAISDVTKTFLNGGENGDADYDSALKELESHSIQMIVAITTDGGIQTKIKEHCETMSSIDNRKERQFILGLDKLSESGNLDQAIENAKARSKALDSKNGMLVFNGCRRYNYLGVQTDFDSSYVAAMLLGIKVGSATTEPLTFKRLNVLSLNRSLTRTQTDDLLENSVAVVNYDSSGNSILVRQLNTYQKNDLLWNEFSAVTAAFYLSQDVRTYLQGIFIGRPNSNATPDVVAGILNARLELQAQNGILREDEQGRAFWNTQVEVLGDTITYDFDANITMPLNFVFITSHLHGEVQSEN